ncbi:hypothetical protein RSOLAG1IB_07399 [Rhizoctonia solani AG-1 IB]|uniref:Uncharacterized protein n=1 Tax=Thanatephorus cucumeris (strain AG1-IB / isolate 7/3/14) TaxID=1108050 RepID=A0A0B7FFB8_THACB|nr:hypothetical protein RSOLAG1IB_07399 [Rhizoctonia solani AG-1 IB]
MGEKKSKLKTHSLRSVVLGTLPPLAYLLNPELRSESVPQTPRTEDSDWALVTPITPAMTRDFPVLPTLTSSSSQVLGSLVSAFKGIPNAETWPMTYQSVGVSKIDWNDKERCIRVPISHLDKAWDALPGSGGSVKALEWLRDSHGVGHESIVLEVEVKGGPHQIWYVCVERYPDTDIATISPSKDRVVRPNSEIRAEIEFPDPLPFSHILRILDIIERVSPTYSLVGSNCWFFASTIVEMLDIGRGPHQTKRARWIRGGCLKLTDHFTTKELNYKQHFQIEQQVRGLLSQPTKAVRPGSWCSMLLACGSHDF